MLQYLKESSLVKHLVLFIPTSQVGKKNDFNFYSVTWQVYALIDQNMPMISVHFIFYLYHTKLGQLKPEIKTHQIKRQAFFFDPSLSVIKSDHASLSVISTFFFAKFHNMSDLFMSSTSEI